MNRISAVLVRFKRRSKSFNDQLQDLEYWAYLWRTFGTVTVAILVFVLLYSIKVFSDRDGSFSSLLFDGKPKPLFNIKDVLIGISGLIAIFATAWRYKLHEIENLLKARDAEIKSRDAEIKERDSSINDSKRLDDQFAKAVELLKENNDVIVRRGGVYILKNLAIKSSLHTQQCIDMLCSLNNWMGSILQADPTFFTSKDSQGKRWSERNLELNLSSGVEDRLVSINNDQFRNTQIISKEVLKVVVDIIKVYSQKEATEQSFINLSSYNLCTVELKEILNLSFLNLQNVNFHASNISDINFDRVNLSHSNLSNSALWHCTMREANLGNATLQGAKLVNVDLRCASLESVSASGIDLNNCSLLGADLRGGNFKAGLFELVQMQGSDIDSLYYDDESFYEDTTFDGAVFYESCFTGASFDGLPSQELLYYYINDDLEKKDFDAIISERQWGSYLKIGSLPKFEWSEQSKGELRQVWKRYEKNREKMTFYGDSDFETDATVEDIVNYWVEVAKKNSALIGHFKSRIRTSDPEANEAIGDAVTQFKEKIKMLNLSQKLDVTSSGNGPKSTDN